MKLRPRFEPLLAATLLLLAGACGGNDDVIPFTLYTPDDQDTFAGVTEVRLTFGEHTKTQSISSSGAGFELELELPTGETSTVLLEGLDASGDTVCVGRSPVINSYPSSEALTLYVARIGTFGRAPVDAPYAATGVAMANYEYEDWDDEDADDVNATLWFGGLTTDGTPAARPFFYDTYFHEAYEAVALPAPRYGMTAMNVSGGNFFETDTFLLFGGYDADHELSDRLDLMWLGAYDFEYSTDVDYGLDGAARAHAPAVHIGPYPSLMGGYDVRVLNSFLVVGGATEDATPACDYLHFVAEIDTGTYGWTISAERRDLAACRLGHTATATDTLSGSDEVRVVLIYGGGQPGEPVAEIVQVNPQQPDVETINWGWVETAVSPDPGPMVTGHAAVTLADGRILVIGGQTADGTVLADGLIFDPGDDSFTPVPDLLATPRWGHAVLRMGHELVVSGGTGPGGVTLDDAEIIDVSATLPAFVDAVPLVVPRTGAQAFHMNTGTMGLIGGLDESGEPTPVIEIYTPGLVQ